MMKEEKDYWKREDFWRTVRGTCGLITVLILLLLLLANCPKVGVPRQNGGYDYDQHAN